MRGAVVVAALLALASGCKTSRKNVLVRVLDVPPGTAALEASFTLDGVPAMSPSRFEAPAGGFNANTTFVVLLPDDATGELGVGVVALDEAACRIGEGTGAIVLPAESMTVGLAHIPPVCDAIDAALPDAGPCDDCDQPPVLRSPRNGATTGSVHASVGPPPLRPELRWEPVFNAASFRVQMDDSCTLPFAGCAFPSPELDEVVSGNTTRFRPATNLPASNAAPVGTRYFWRVQVCDRDGFCSPWSAIRYLDVGRQSGDLNGDGYAESIMGSYGQDFGASLDVGTVFVLYGGAVPATAPQQNLTSSTPQIGGAFGAYVAAVGDVNADGFGDAILGSPLYDSVAMDEGQLQLFLGSGVGLTVPTQIFSPDHVAAGVFGSRIAGAGDLNGDGYADFVVSGHASENASAEMDEGDVYVYYGGPTVPMMTPPLRINNPLAAQPGALFGISLGMNGDVDGDGYADLVVGAIRSSQGATMEGAVFVFRGSSAGIAPPPTPPVIIDCPGNEAGAMFGTATELGDVNGDGFDDLLTGAEEHDGTAVNEGIAFVFHGARGGLPSSPSLAIETPGHSAGARFSDDAALADVNGDGFLDAVIAAPGFSGIMSQVGEVYVYFGGSGGLEPSAPLVLPAPNMQVGGQFSSALAAPGDVDGDGFADFIAGSMFMDVGAMDSGATHLFLGSPIGPDTTPSREYSSPMPQIGSYFGCSVAWRDR